MVIQHIINIISGGSLFALITLGLALLVGLMGLMNFAYGELIMVGGFTMYLVRDEPWPVLIGATILAVVLVSVLCERIAFRPLRDAPALTLLVASFTVSVMLQNIARMTVGAQTRGVPPWQDLQNNVDLLGAQVAPLDLVTIAVTLVILGALAALMHRTRIGIQLRAAAEDFEMARVLGVKGDRVIAVAFAITGVMAAAATLILIEDQGAVTATVGSTPVLIAFVGVVLGGTGTLVGATAGGFLLGAVTRLMEIVLPNDLVGFRDAFVFAAVIAVLVLRPQGLIPGRTARVA
jgi:branched-chain amino acid transport system permease protein